MLDGFNLDKILFAAIGIRLFLQHTVRVDWNQNQSHFRNRVLCLKNRKQNVIKRVLLGKECECSYLYGLRRRIDI